MPSSFSGSLPPPSAAAVASALGSEEGLVGEICTPGGMRSAPDPEDLRKFVEAASLMDGLRIGELLIAKMVRPGASLFHFILHFVLSKQCSIYCLTSFSLAFGQTCSIFSSPSPMNPQRPSR